MNHFTEHAKTWDENPQRHVMAQQLSAAIRQRLPLNNTMTAFEYGCGTGLLAFALQPYFQHLTLADSADGMLEVLNEKLKASDIRNISVCKLDLTVDTPPLQTFDVIYSSMTMHHVEDLLKMLTVMYGMLNPNGYLVIIDLDQEDGTFHDHTNYVHTGFNRDELQRMANTIGFRTVDIDTVSTMHRVRDGREREYTQFMMCAQK